MAESGERAVNFALFKADSPFTRQTRGAEMARSKDLIGLTLVTMITSRTTLGTNVLLFRQAPELLLGVLATMIPFRFDQG